MPIEDTGFTTATQPIAGKPAPTGYVALLAVASAEGVGVWLANDLPRSGSKFGAHGWADTTQAEGFTAAARQIASNVERHPGCSHGLSARIKRKGTRCQ